MTNLDSLDIILQVTDILDLLGVPYVIGGSVASIIHGTIRTTMDVDIIADLRPDHISSFLTPLQQDFYVDEHTVRQAIGRQSSFNLVHLTTMFKVDVFILKERSFDRQQIARRVAANIRADSDRIIWVLTPEDVILAKLDWLRMGGGTSEQQWRDILGVMKSQQETLDFSYLQKWAEELNVIDLLERALSELNSGQDRNSQ